MSSIDIFYNDRRIWGDQLVFELTGVGSSVLNGQWIESGEAYSRPLWTNGLAKLGWSVDKWFFYTGESLISDNILYQAFATTFPPDPIREIMPWETTFLSYLGHGQNPVPICVLEESALLSGQPTPFLGKTIEYIQAGERWGQKENWTLQGTLIGCNITELVYNRDLLLSGFSQAFGSMSILTTPSGYDLDIIEVNDIEIEDSDYLQNLSYSIGFSTYPRSSFSGINHSGVYGVLEPSDSINYTEQDDGAMQMVREISAKGILTDASNKDSAINNAKAFIISRKDYTPQPFLIRNTKNENLVLKYYLVSSEESTDRITNTVKLSQTFKTDITSEDGDLINRYTINEEENVSNKTVVTYNGQIDAGKYGDISRARSLYKSFRDSLNIQFLIDEKVEEDLYINRIKYTFSYYKDQDSKHMPKVEDDFRISISENEENGLFSVSINGGLAINYGCMEERDSEIENAIKNVRASAYHFDILETIYSDFYKTTAGSAINKPSEISLNRVPLQKTEDKNDTENTASYSAEFNDRYIPAVFRNYQSVDTEISKDFAIEAKSIKEHYYGGRYICQELGYNQREAISIRINSLTKGGVFIGEGANNTFAKQELANFKNSDAEKVWDGQKSYAANEYERTEEFSTSQSYNTLESFLS